MLRSEESGFTLVELTIVLAVSAGLIVIALNGQAKSRQSVQFKYAVERTANVIDVARNNAVNSVDPLNGAGNSTTQIKWGKLVTINAYGSIVTITDIVGSNPNQMTDGSAQTLTLGTATDFQIPWGTKYNGSTKLQFVFHRLLTSGVLVTYQLTPADNPLTVIYNENPTSSPTISIPLIDQVGARTGQIVIDGPHGGSVSSSLSL